MSGIEPSDRGRGALATLPLKSLFFLLYVAFNWRFFAERLDALTSTFSLLAYVGLTGPLVLAIGASALCRNLVTRWGLATLLAVLSFADAVYFRSVAAYLTYDSYLLMLNSRGSTGDALTQFALPVLYSLPASLCLLLAIGMRPGGLRWLRIGSPAAFSAVLVSIVCLCALLFLRGGYGATGLPGGLSVLAYAGLGIYEEVTAPVRVREPVTLPHDGSDIDFDIVLIIDESVRGDYLDINHSAGVYSGLEELPEGLSMVNLGLAASATNCSVGSNMILRFGTTRADYLDQIWRIPSIWQYAKQAGLPTVYIDAQSEHRFFNGMDDREIQDIDEIIQFHDVEPLHRDQEAAAALVEKLNDDKAQLIVVNKLGPHFPIHDKYPDDHAYYAPALPRGNYVDMAISGKMPQLFDGDWEAYRNTYKNTVVWTVGRFFDKLFAEAELDSALIVYTADHGQYFHERGEPGLRTHCEPGSQPAMEEGAVPLLVLYNDRTLSNDDAEALQGSFSRASHYSVMPTLLDWMGFEPGESPYYEPSLLRMESDPYTFNARFYARLGLKPYWIRVRNEKLVGPDGVVPGKVTNDGKGAGNN